MTSTRDVGISVQIQKTTLVDVVGVKEEMFYINHSISDRSVIVGTKLYDSSGAMLKEDAVLITGLDYEVLMSSDKVIFREDKSENEFNETDVWVMVDRVRNS